MSAAFPLAPVGARQSKPFDAIYIRHNNMYPDIPRGSVAFIDPPGYTGEGVYSIPLNGEHRGDLRRICFAGTGYVLGMDNWPEEDKAQPISGDILSKLGVRRVAGIVRPFTAGFNEFLQSVAPQTLG